MLAPLRSPSPAGGPAHDGRLRRGYVFAVSALAAFAIALMVQRDMGADYLATATLTSEETEGQPSQAIEKGARGIERTLTTSDTIRQAASDAGVKLESEVADAKSSHQGTTITELRKRLTVQRSKVVDGVATLNISFIGTEQQPALRQVNALAQQAARSQSSANRGSTASQQSAVVAEQAAATAAHDLAEARRKRDNFVATNQKLLTAPLASQGPALPSLETATEARREAESAVRQRVRQLDRRLEELQSVRKQLLASMTPEHPHYQLVRDQIAQLQAEIDDANKSLESAKPPRDEAAAADSRAQEAQRMQAQKQQTLLDELAILERNVVVQKQRHEALMQEAAEARRLALAQPVRELWRVDEAESARRVPRPTSLPSVLVAMGIAVVVGSATLLIGGAIRTIDRPADVEELLQVRLLGSLSDPGEVISGRTRSSRLPSRWVLLASEATVAVFLGAMVIVALLNHDFAAQVVSDPLSGLAEGVRRLPAAFGGPVL